MADYKSGAQPATIMHQIAKGYTDEQIKLVAAYFAAQPAKK
jgi:sulfide dehydrogenase cytochrome subunit